MRKRNFYWLYWAAYVLLFALIEGVPAGDFLIALGSGLAALAPKVIFVALVTRYLIRDLREKRFLHFMFGYLPMILIFAVLLRIIDNRIILPYLLPDWKKEPLLSVAPFLYDAIKLQFLVTIPVGLELLTEPVPKAGVAVLQIKCERRLVSLPLADIRYVEAQGNYLLVNTKSAVYKTLLSFGQLEQQLPASGFIRVHRSFIVAMGWVEQRYSTELQIAGKMIPVGRSYRETVKNAFIPSAYTKKSA